MTFLSRSSLVFPEFIEATAYAQVWKDEQLWAQAAPELSKGIPRLVNTAMAEDFMEKAY
jgi:hypothetical protein